MATSENGREELENLIKQMEETRKTTKSAFGTYAINKLIDRARNLLDECPIAPPSPLAEDALSGPVPTSERRLLDQAASQGGTWN